MDKLDTLFQLQKQLNCRIGIQVDNMNQEEKVQWLLNYSRALQQENAELVDSVPWKWWAKYQKLDLQNARVEVVDMFHFLISMAQTLEMTALDVFEAYLKKHQVNHDRQDEGYSVKNHADSSHI